MRCLRTIMGAALVLAAVGGSFAHGDEQPAAQDATAGLRISGPVVHENLAVYFLLRDKRDDREFLTLNDGLAEGLVKVTEKENEQVNLLMIENLSDQPLFLQEGDRVTGGKQDRTIYSSLVIAPKSGPQEIPAFCVEPSRWQVGETGRAFKGNASSGYAANSVRQASKLGKDQGQVWENVARSKAALMQAVGTQDKSSSLNEAQDSEQVAASTKPFVEALRSAAQKHEDLVGVAFALNGQIQEVNIYPGRAITRQIYPRLLETYALDAVVQAKTNADAAKAKAPSADELLAFMRTPVATEAQRDEKIDGDNRLQIFAAAAAPAEGEQTRVYRCETDYQGNDLHVQWLRGPASLEAAVGRDNQVQQQLRQNDQINAAPDQQLDNVQQLNNPTPNQEGQSPLEPQQQGGRQEQ